MIWLQPWALAGMPAVGLLAVLLFGRRRSALAALPGDWARIVEPPLRRYLAGDGARDRRGPLALCLLIAALIVLALARPALDRPDGSRFAAIAGRVVVADLGGAAPDVARLRLAVSDLLDAATDVPTALIAVAGDAYAVVPLTTDATQIRRYLGALAPDVMPEEGRALHRGLTRAEAMLSRAGVAIGQIVLVSAGPPPDPAPATVATDVERIVAPLAGSEGWEDLAAAHQARLVEAGELPAIATGLHQRAADLTRARAPDAVLELTPYVVGLALCLWLALFRRREGP